MNVGQRIKQRRTELEMSLEALANKLGVNKSTVYRYETGEIEKMPIGVIKPIAEALGVTPAFIMGWDDEHISAVSEIQEDADTYSDSNETVLKDVMLEISEIGFSHYEIQRIREYAHALKEAENASDELHSAFIELFINMYKLGLSIDDVHEIYTYAQFLRSKRN